MVCGENDSTPEKKKLNGATKSKHFHVENCDNSCFRQMLIVYIIFDFTHTFTTMFCLYHKIEVIKHPFLILCTISKFFDVFVLYYYDYSTTLIILFECCMFSLDIVSFFIFGKSACVSLVQLFLIPND